MDDLYGLIMAGGTGTRFWPESTRKRPKQYLNLLGGKSLLQQTLARLSFIPHDHRFVVTIKEQGRLVNDQAIGQLDRESVIFEPEGRNTAPCLLLSLARLKACGMRGTDVLGVMPADHVILNSKGFESVVREAKALAQETAHIITIGIPPTFPHTGYGYIEKGPARGPSAFLVESFKEKPDRATAMKYVSSGDYLWNGGMFVGTLDTFLKEIELCAPELFRHFQGLLANINNDEKIAALYKKIPKNSIDYALMEKTTKIMAIPARFDWNDLGSWDALEAVIEEKKKNTCVSAMETYFDGASGNIIFAPDKFVSLINVKDLIVVSNDSAVMVLPKKDSQKVKDIVAYLKNNGELSETLL